jgi:hypothetical protein
MSKPVQRYGKGWEKRRMGEREIPFLTSRRAKEWVNPGVSK